MIAFYNEIDPYCCAWLSNLMDAGLITPGVISNESIEDLTPNELIGYDRVHFFAGIGGWDYALNLASWGERPVWTGSCPCQPFSAAGKGVGFADERHLWPQFHYLIEECRPPVVFGEQVASKDGLDWLNLVQADLEGTGYRTAAADLCAAGVGAPHIRQRLYWAADSEIRSGRTGLGDSGTRGNGVAESRNDSRACGLDNNNNNEGLERLGNGHQASRGWVVTSRPIAATGESLRMEHDPSDRRQQWRPESSRRGAAGGCEPCGVGYATSAQQDAQRNAFDGARTESDRGSTPNRPGPTNGFWRNADWLGCRDGKWRPVEPGTFPLAHGVPARVGKLRAYGNAIVPQVAQVFIEAYLEI